MFIKKSAANLNILLLLLYGLPVNFSSYFTTNIRGKLRYFLYIITFKPIAIETTTLFILNHRSIYITTTKSVTPYAI